MKKIKRKIIVILLCAVMSVAVAVPARAMITVNDPAGLAQAILGLMEMMKQVEALYAQYESISAQLEAVTGSRNLGQIFDNPALYSYLPDDWRSVYSKIQSGGYSGLTGNANSILTSNRIYDVCAALNNATAKTACEREIALAAQNKDFSSSAYDKTTERLTQIEQLMAQINATQDEKGALEVIGRINAENAMIQNEMTRMQLYKMLADSEQKLVEQQKRELAHQEVSKKSGVKFNFKPLEIK